ncbi:amidase [Micractinium conductrix]|uniref:Amidase n=1 Tax=Micractinium conductrix TaxID=554055 RepID=A0A2P6V3F9_9CHLO|nr:amidase [Micractinium conductrix]|eukprot:PSC68633.1 amidase [Micractinium conductrix]
MVTAAAAVEPTPRRSEGCYLGDVRVVGAEKGPLAGLTAVVKDSFDIAGHRTSNGSPAWLESHPPAERHAAAVQLLLDAGAQVVGKNLMDEMAYSLAGENAHYGTPVNPAAPGRIPGGSSSGTAAAVAAGDADLGLGGDTGGSVRVPACHCGILGIRPTHGRVSLAGAAPLAPSFDTAGWFARDPAVLRRAGSVLLDPSTRRPATLRRLLVAQDAFALAEPATVQALYGALSSKIAEVSAMLSKPEEVDIASSGGGLDPAWFNAFQEHQAFEVWRQHGAWVREQQPAFGPGVRERFDMAAGITQQQFEAAAAVRAAARARLAALLGGDGVLLLPTAPAPPCCCGTPPAELDAFRRSLISLTCISGLSGFPQVNLPVASVEGLPVGLGLIGPPGSDEDLLQLTEQLMSLLAPGGGPAAR